MTNQYGKAYTLGMKDTKQIGDITEAIILAELLKVGCSVLLPFGERHRYDLVLDEGGTFVRVQCKTGRLRRGAVRFNTSSVVKDAATKKYVKKYYGEEDIDFYGVYCPETGQCYMVPVGDVARTEGSLRIAHLKGQAKGRLASSYEVHNFRKVKPIAGDGTPLLRERTSE